jgi:D-lyxose ketol-isomerase
MYKLKRALIMLKILNKEIGEIFKEAKERILKAMTLYPEFAEFKNQYFFRTVDKSSREVIDKEFSELRDVMKYYKNEVTKSETKHYYLVRRFDNKENVILLG